MSCFSLVIAKILSLVILFFVEIFKERRFCDAKERFGAFDHWHVDPPLQAGPGPDPLRQIHITQRRESDDFLVTIHIGFIPSILAGSGFTPSDSAEEGDRIRIRKGR